EEWLARRCHDRLDHGAMRPRLRRDVRRGCDRRLRFRPAVAGLQSERAQRHGASDLCALRGGIPQRVRQRSHGGVAGRIQRCLDALSLRDATRARPGRQRHGGRGAEPRPAGGDAGERRWREICEHARGDGTEHPGGERHLAVAGRPPQRYRVPAGLRDGHTRLHPASAVIQVRLAAPRRAARVTGLILGAALLRALLLPAGDLLSTIVFAACLLSISWFERDTPTLPSTASGGGKGPAIKGMLAGLVVGAVLLAPVVSGPFSARPVGAFLAWAAIAALVATLEE